MGTAVGRYNGSGSVPIVPENVRYISSTAFNTLPISSVKLHGGILGISDFAFYNCRSMKIIEIPDSVKEMGKYAVGYYEEYAQQYNKQEHLIIVGKKGSAAERYAIDNGFIFCDSYVQTGKCGDNAVWEVDLHNNTLTITGSGDMYNLDSGSYIDHPEETSYRIFSSFIKSVEVCEGITSLGNEAFEGFRATQNLSLPDTLKRIGEDALRDIGVRVINLPAGIEEIGSHYFGIGGTNEDHSVTEEINVKEGGVRYFSDHGVLYDKKEKELVCIPEGCRESEIIVPDGITSINTDAYRSLVNVHRFVLPEGFIIGNYDMLQKDYESAYDVVFLGDGYDESKFSIFVSNKNIFSDADLKRINVYCHFSKPGWKELIDHGVPLVIFHDLDTITDDFSISSEKTEIEPFEAVKIDLIVEKAVLHLHPQ